MSAVLTTLQQPFQDYLLGSGAIAPELRAMIADQYGLDAQSRLAIYFDGYRIRLRAALGEAYDKTHALVGDAVFRELCDGYIDAAPSRFRNLRWYGQHFAQHIAGVMKAHPFVAELAQFEWALGVAFDAADAPLLTIDGLAALNDDDWGQIGFAVQPSLQILSLEWNVAAMWLALEAGMAPPAAQPAASYWLVWRKELQPHFRSVNSMECAALRSLASGSSFASVCATAMERDAGQDVTAGVTPDVTTQVAGWLHVWMAEQLLRSVRPGSTAA